MSGDFGLASETSLGAKVQPRRYNLLTF